MAGLVKGALVAAMGEGRAALLRAAVTVIAEGGLRALTYRRVAEQAGVAHSLVRHHFGSRDALIGEALRFAVDESLHESNFSPGAQGIDEFAAGLVEAVSQDSELQAFQYELVLEARRRPELREHVERYYDAYRSATERQLERFGIDDPQLAEVAWLALDSLVFRQLVLGDTDASARAIETLRRILREHLER